MTRQASGIKGESLDTWAYHGSPIENDTGEGAFAELTFLSIKGDQGVVVSVCNKTMQLTTLEIDNLGPDLFWVPPGCTVHLNCARREGRSGGCEVKYRFRWLR